MMLTEAGARFEPFCNDGLEIARSQFHFVETESRVAVSVWRIGASIWLACVAVQAASTASRAAAQTTDSIPLGRLQQSAATEHTLFTDAARAAWQHFNRLWQPATGLANATPGYDKLTSWDLGSVLAALVSARELGLIDDAVYKQRLGRTLQTMERMPLFEKAVFNKMYSSRTGRMVGRGGVVSNTGYGWSATDLGRLLIWLRIVADREPALRAQTGRIVARIDMTKVVSAGYMFGQEIMRTGTTRRFQEGRIGYEQYAARGFALWGQSVEPALDLHRNARPIQVLGIPMLTDVRGLDRINSEPFVLAGLETGWTPEFRDLAVQVLAIQKARYETTGIITIVSEDALAVPPYYFYYYCVYCSGEAFVIEVADPGKSLDQPRWVSTKAAFAWYALLPGTYTSLALQRVAKAKTSAGWSSGVFEHNGKPTYTYDINTAAIILEAAAVRRRGRAFLDASALSMDKAPLGMQLTRLKK